ncbi:hypothetical protein UA08_01778 [Talaromyces atroroseus]|uniref:Carrier domain-containing protein n=1 Tax=Talaromyces atroroseus TaxID=1441469 RepID=A0A1Q5QBU2_TALAT|nr:hypothetical protein UA08_01778 [Talaromyces atroroseus]OKL63405.1 hypothetical protein UA08_01778 [Talaromyces atroroseus]
MAPTTITITSSPPPSSSSSSFVSTAERKYGRNALANLFDKRAKDPSSSKRVFAHVLKTPNPADGFDSITFSTVANAINRAAWWLVNDIGLADGDVFGYMGPPDLRYLILSMAATKTGRKIMLPSLRNTIPAQITLFERTNTRIILYGGELEKNLQSLFAAVPAIEKREALGYQELIDETSVPHYEAQELSDEKLHEPIFLLHTSGSSGNPKPVGQSAAFWLRALAFLDVPDDGGIHNVVNVVGGKALLQFFPSFHMAGLYFQILAAFLDKSSLILNHAAAPITGEHVLKMLNYGVATALAAADSILSDLSKSKEGLDALSKLDMVVYGGGPLSPQTGSTLAPYVKNMSSLLGMTENALFHCVQLKGTSHWDCLKFNSHVGYHFAEASPGRYELIISFSPKYAMFHPAALIFPNLREYATKDLYSRVPGVQNCYRYEGRKDDLIVLSNGEKINPRPMEAIVASHAAVQSALFVGEYRFLPSLLIELRDGYAVNNEEETRAMVDTLWGTISKANLEAPRFSRVPKSLVYILSPAESFSRSGKMTVQRQITVSKFAAQIDALYAAAGEGLLTEGLGPLDSSSPESMVKLARNLYIQALFSEDAENKGLGDDDDVFELGMDSLQVAVLVQKLKAALRTQNLKAASDKISPHFFYTSPSSSKLARSIDHLINGADSVKGHGIDMYTDRRARIQYMIDKYSTGLDEKLPPKGTRADNLTVILTGSTGSLGSYLLHSLTESPRISKVVCLNRSTKSQQRQTAGNKLKELPTPWESSDSDKTKSKTAVQFLTADFSKPDLGLGGETYSHLLATVDAIIHCAWKVDFNHTIESFEKGHIAGTRHFIDFSRKCQYRAPIVFISSISTIFNWRHTHPGQAVPESSIHDVDSPEFLGYGESKYVAERLVEAHSASSGFTSSFMRVGQIAGPVLSTAGVWNVQEWFPSMLASSKYLGLLPDSLGTMVIINWIPVDVLARVIVQLLGTTYDASASSSLLVYNLVNPRAVPWSNLLDTVRREFGGPDKTRTVSLTEWVEALERSAQDNYGFVVESNPAIKLLGFWKNVAGKNKNTRFVEQAANGESTHGKLRGEFEVTGLQRDSSEASSLKAVSAEWMKIWLKQWAF